MRSPLALTGMILVWTQLIGGIVSTIPAQEPSAARSSELLEAFKAACKQGASEFQVPPGVYEFDQFRISQVKDMTISADGATFIFPSRVKEPSFFLHRCQNVQVKGLTIDHSPLPWSQGVVTEIMPSQRRFTYRVDEGYPLPDSSWGKDGGGNTKVIPFTPDGRRMLPVKMDWVKNVEVRGRLVTVELSQATLLKTRGTKFALKARVALPDRNTRNAVAVRECVDCRLENITLYSAPNVGFSELDSSGIVYEGCKAVRRPDSNRLLGTSADTFHVARSSSGPKILNCEAEFAGDDFVNIHGGLCFVTRVVTPGQVDVLAHTADELPVGETVDIAPPDFSKVAQGKITERTELMGEDILSARATARAFGVLPEVAARCSAWRVTITGDVRENYVLSAPSRLAVEPVVAGCRFRNGFVRGVLINGRDALVEGNQITRIGGCAVWMGADPIWLNGPLSKGGIIRNNQYSETHLMLHGLKQEKPITVGNLGINGLAPVPGAKVSQNRMK